MRAALVVVSASLALVACGGKSVSPTAAAVAQAADKTTAIGSEHVRFSGYVVAAGQTVTLSGNGDFQQHPQLGRASLSLSGGPINTSLDEVIDGWTLYMHSPLFAGQLPEGASWFALDLQKFASKVGVNLGQLSQTSPVDTLAALKKAGSVSNLGAARIDGVATTHYQAVVDLAKMPGGKNLAKLAHLSAVPVDVWIDGRGLMRRMTLSEVVTANGQTAATRLTMDLSNFGEKVHVTIPSQSDTFDATSLAG